MLICSFDYLFRYVHSYQSYLWNHAASIRVQKYGMWFATSTWNLCRILLFPTYSPDHQLVAVVTFLFDYMAGAQGLVVGDLVHSKEDSGEIISLHTEYEDFVSNEADNSTNLEDMEVDVLDQKTFSVKVSCVISFCRQWFLCS